MTHPSVMPVPREGPAAPLFDAGFGCRDRRLTPQETRLLWLLIQGHHKKTAADALGVSINTVSFHLKNIYVKLQVHSKTEAVVKALLEGLVPVARS